MTIRRTAQGRRVEAASYGRRRGSDVRPASPAELRRMAADRRAVGRTRAMLRRAMRRREALMSDEISMSLEEAEAVRLPFGKHRGRTLGEIAAADVLYLDWLIGRDIRSDRLALALAMVCEDRHREIADRLEARE